MTRTGTMEQAVLAELLAEFRAAQAQSTEVFGRWRSSITNDVLASGVYTLDPNFGTASDSYQTPFGSLFVVNHSSSTVTVTNAGPVTSPPAGGKGVGMVPAGGCRLINLAGMAWTVYGVAGGQVGVEAFTRSWPPVATAGGGLAAAGTGGPAAVPTVLPAVAAAVVNTTLAAANPKRRGLVLMNDQQPSGTATLAVRLDGGDSTVRNSFTLQPNDRYELAPVVQNAITGVWSAATGVLRVTEFS